MGIMDRISVHSPPSSSSQWKRSAGIGASIRYVSCVINMPPLCYLSACEFSLLIPYCSIFNPVLKWYYAQYDRTASVVADGIKRAFSDSISVFFP